MEWTSSIQWWAVVAWVMFALSALGLLIHTVCVGFRVGWYKAPPLSEDHVPVSVVIAARNESRNLAAHLPAIFAQDYPQFEVVVVNDASYDDTGHVLNELAGKHPNMHIVTIPKNDRHDGGKKLAITLGIKAAKYERLLFTDADCRPATKDWIRTVIGSRKTADSLVLGYSPYEKSKGLLNALIRTDAWITALDYFGFALAGMPYMGVGRNLSYAKERFFEIGGFRSHYALASGDDDLFVNQVATPENTAICMAPDAHVFSLPKKSWRGYWHQKRRHLTTGHRYRRIHKILLAAKPLAMVFLFLSALYLLIFGNWLPAVVSVLAGLLLLRWIVLYRSVRWLGHGDILIFAPVLEVAVLVGTAAAHLANIFSKPNQWKKQ